MNNSKTIYIRALGLSILLFVSGHFLFLRTFMFFEPQIDGITFQIIEHKSTITTSTAFSLLLFSIPIFILLTWQIARINSFNKRVASVLLMLTFIVLAIFARHQQVKTYFTTVVKPALLTHGKASIIYPIDPINFIYYMLAGLITGCLLAFVFFKQRKTGFNLSKEAGRQ
ncbi:hypothetical protein QTN47_21510 [Danxiaibacter flavus]|uniref:Uncharacterized protein n=1 Tax=Danxiaibacter flavus TaxID=3049108 RepID=A0ABV3ZJP8_9BACT|nr:hypothetical protein QNM32_21515 [Chitinophagaceae bacterium DXS]